MASVSAHTPLREAMQALTNEYLDRCEREYIKYALNTYKSSYAAAEALGTSQSSIMRRKRKYGLD